MSPLATSMHDGIRRYSCTLSSLLFFPPALALVQTKVVGFMGHLLFSKGAIHPYLVICRYT